ncbi:hypothetical protein NADFUDRAFT_81341 [Nadsonia fulvescens var. elongata DSM 6958]|uniref:RRM domain-containing protein n=1 Tax=Nadsonia fulvescens var. elongata DSM 6958 TaxID=857566 RepID=A0A1E3PSW7_9ASCO|nr:hypothetical protein NADFUDRAFT_81341 [Nadsonia fulvescens var. elongata DSM 6958]
MLLSPFGDIISIVALKTPEMRGQAHIAFADVTSATTALQTLQGTLFLGKAMKMAFAKTKSHAIAKLDGTFILGDYGLKTDPPKALNENDSEKDNDTAIAYQMESDEEVTEKEDPIVSGTLKETLGAKRYRQEDN